MAEANGLIQLHPMGVNFFHLNLQLADCQDMQRSGGRLGEGGEGGLHFAIDATEIRMGLTSVLVTLTDANV